MTNQNETNIKSIEENITELTNGNVEIQKKFKTKWLGAVVLGILCFILQRIDTQNGSLTMFLIVMGIASLCGGIIMFLVKQNHYYYNGQELKLYELDFDAEKSGEINSLYSAENFEELKKISHKTSSIIKIKILCDDNCKTVYSQMFKFIPYEFKPCTEVKFHNNVNSSAINQLIKSRA
ncbi:MAG: hypothetical protein MJ211_10490 [Bacteroidales bacterium]|nr:hypothetical protein [Bacteroidales bacterium]